MHICHVTSALAGGPATSIALLSRRQAATGHEVTLVYSSRRDEIWPYRRRFDHLRTAVPWNVGRSIGLRDLAAFAELHRILRQLAPDLVHLHCSKAGALGRLATRQLRLPSVYSPRGVSFTRTDSLWRSQLYQSLERTLSLTGVPVVACSPSEGAHLASTAPSVHVIPNVVDLETLDRAVATARRTAPAFTVGILGLIKDQRMPGLVRELVLRTPAGWRWVWVGDGALRAVVEGLPNLEITGWCQREEALRRLAEADLVLHASRWEGMPNALLEAMGMGKPVVVSDVVGTRDVVTDEVDGLLVREVYAIEPYLAALDRLASSPELRSRLGTAARAKIARDHDPERIYSKWDEVYALALERARSWRRPAPMRPSAARLARAPFEMDH